MNKSRDAFRTISEVAELLDTPAHVLRFWESKFTQVKPVKRAGGRRYYRPGDIALLAGIKKLLHEDGLTIKGAQKVLREQGVKHVSALVPLPIDTDVEEIEDAPFAEVPPETAQVLPFAPADSDPDDAKGADDQPDLFAPEAPEETPEAASEAPLPDFLTQSLDERHEDEADADDAPLVEDTVQPPESAPLETTDAPEDATVEVEEIPAEPDHAEDSEPAEEPAAFDAPAFDAPEDDIDLPTIDDAFAEEVSEAAPETDLSDAQGGEPEIDTAPAEAEFVAEDPDTKLKLDARDDAPEPDTAPNEPEAVAEDPDAFDALDIAPEIDSASGEVDSTDEQPAPEPADETFEMGPEADSSPEDASLAEAPESHAPLAEAVEEDAALETATEAPEQPAPPLPDIPAPEDMPAGLPGALSHLAGIDRLTAEQSLRVAPHVAALRLWLDENGGRHRS